MKNADLRLKNEEYKAKIPPTIIDRIFALAEKEGFARLRACSLAGKTPHWGVFLHRSVRIPHTNPSKIISHPLRDDWLFLAEKEGFEPSNGF